MGYPHTGEDRYKLPLSLPRPQPAPPEHPALLTATSPPTVPFGPYRAVGSPIPSTPETLILCSGQGVQRLLDRLTCAAGFEHPLGTAGLGDGERLGDGLGEDFVHVGCVQGVGRVWKLRAEVLYTRPATRA